MRLETRILDFIDGMAPPVTADEAIARRHSPSRSLATTKTVGSGRGPAWALAAFALVLTLAGSYFAFGGGDGQVAKPPTVPTPELFTDIAADSTIDLPDAPILDRTSPAVVWTGTEMIVWGGTRFDPVTDSWGQLTDGAAFNLADGTWRVIAPAPIGDAGLHDEAVWTGTEMLVLGTAAAYNPASDTWRRLPSPPVSVGAGGIDWSTVWTGDEAVVLGRAAAAAYDPVTDSWRRLAGPPSVDRPVTWAGRDSIMMVDREDMVDHYDVDMESTQMMRYDLTADRWTLADIGSSAALVGVSGSDGFVSSFVNLPSEMGVPTQILDGNGSPMAELPAFPGDAGVFDDGMYASGVWVGDEAVFWIRNSSVEEAVRGAGTEQVWAVNPSTGAWRQLDYPALASRASCCIHEPLVVVGDVLLLEFVEVSPDGEGPYTYRAYRSVPTPTG